MIETAPGRREANKARTRDAVVGAAMALADGDPQGGAALTIDQVAEAAGISRRTFFNYFPGLDAVLAHRAIATMEAFRAELGRRPADEPLLDGAISAVESFFTTNELGEVARSWRVLDRNAGAYRFALESTSGTVAQLAGDWIGARDGVAPSPLRVRVLAAALLAAFEVARKAWLDGHPGDIDETSRRAFVGCVADAFEFLRPAVEPPLSSGTGDPVR